MMGYDTIFFSGSSDSQLVATALAENRVILTRDTQIMKRRLVTNGRLKAVLIQSDVPEKQMGQVIEALNLDCQFQPFSIGLECNQPLAEKRPQQVKSRVPPYGVKPRSQYVECPACRRIYWRGTHWQAMTRTLEKFKQCWR